MRSPYPALAYKICRNGSHIFVGRCYAGVGGFWTDLGLDSWHSGWNAKRNIRQEYYQIGVIVFIR